MTYPDPTTAQMFIIAVVVMVPLVWAFTHHGNTRMITLVIWIPLWLFVARAVYLIPAPWSLSLEGRLKWALFALLGDPLTIAWPVFVLLTFGLIRLSTASRRRREARARSAPSANLPLLRESERPADLEPTKRCLGCNRHVLRSAGTCPHCRYSFAPGRTQRTTAEAVVASPREPPSPQTQPQRERSVNVADGVVAERIRMLGALRDDGLLTEEEFEEKKTVLLSNWPHRTDAMRSDLT